ncbi:PIG-L deacetylase family protein [Thermodesulfobacteriota bacterium]
MQAREGARYLFLFAHPDDDAFIVGSMRMLLDQGVDVYGVWATSGGLLGGSKTRESELAAAMTVLGLDESRRFLLRMPDLGLIANLAEAADAVTKVVEEVRPTTVVATAFEGGHPDHDCVNFLAYEGCSRVGITPEMMEFPLYNGSGRVIHWRWKVNSFPDGKRVANNTPLTDSALDCKYRILRTYSTQWLYMFPLRLASPRSKMKSSGEPCRRSPGDRDHTMPPHPGKLNYERWFNSFMKISFKDYADAVRSARRSMR